MIDYSSHYYILLATQFYNVNHRLLWTAAQLKLTNMQLHRNTKCCKLR